MINILTLMETFAARKCSYQGEGLLRCWRDSGCEFQKLERHAYKAIVAAVDALGLLEEVNRTI